MRKKIVEVMLALLNKQLGTTIKMVQNLICVQDAYINTYHPDFMGGANSITNVFDVNNYNQRVAASESTKKDGDTMSQASKPRA